MPKRHFYIDDTNGISLSLLKLTFICELFDNFPKIFFLLLFISHAHLALTFKDEFVAKAAYVVS